MGFDLRHHVSRRPRRPSALASRRRRESVVAPGSSAHIDPASLEFADATTEVCDGLPSDVEDAAITSDRYCPWSAVVTDLEE